MPPPKYYYNPRTLKYEPAGVPWGSLIIYICGLACFALLFFWGLLMAQNRIVETEREAALRNENKALAEHRSRVAQQLSEAEIKLASLSNREGELHKRIFLSERPTSGPRQNYSKELLGYELPEFHELLNTLDQKVNNSYAKAAVNNYEFSRLFWPRKRDVSDLQGYPTMAPLAGFDLGKLGCGFGNHINPFNKRLYHHAGMDIVAERGTPVRATAAGRVVAAVKNETPAGDGHYIEIEHTNGYRTRYAHLDEVSVHYWQTIKQGDLIGTVGTSGGSISPHLHYEVLRNQTNLNPALFFIEELSESELHQLADLSKKTKQSLD